MVYIKTHILLCLRLCAVCEGSAEERREGGVVVMLCLRVAVLNLFGVFFGIFAFTGPETCSCCGNCLRGQRPALA